MALSFSDWYRAYANQPGMGGSAVSDPILEQLARNVTNPAYETAFQTLLTKLGNVGRNASGSRAKMAEDARTAAFTQGLSDETETLQDRRVAGNASLGTSDAITYKIKMGPDGRAYRQAFLNTSSNFGARGWGGSEEKAAQWRARQDLNTARDTITTGLAGDQNQSLLKQGTDEGDVMGDLSKNVTDYGAWKVDKMPQSPGSGTSSPSNPGSGTPAPDPAPAAAAAPDKFRGVKVGGILGTYGKSPVDKTLAGAYGAGNYKVKKAGNGKFVVVRTR